MEALAAGTASSSLLPARRPSPCLAPNSLALRPRPCGPLRAASPSGGGGAKDDAQAGTAVNGSPVLKSKNDPSQNGPLGPIVADKPQKASSTNTNTDSSGSRAGLFRTPISGGVQSATFSHGLPPPALAVRNLMEQARFAHLCSVMSGMHHRRTGYPFGSLVDFANDSMGHPIFSLSPLAIHTRNLLADPRCTLVVQVPGWSGLSNARVTIFGDVYPLPAEQQEWAHKQYVAKHQQWASQQWGNFYYYRMHNISDIYFIGGFGTVAWVDVKDYEIMQPDKIAVDGGEQSLKELNAIFSKPLREFLSQEGEVDDAALISVDSKGIDIRVRQGAQVKYMQDCYAYHQRMLFSGVGAGGMESALAKRLVQMYVKCGDLGSARKVLDEMPQASDVCAWTTLMSGYAKAGDFQQGVLLFRQMHCCGVTPDAHAVSCVLKCIASLGDVMDGEMVHGYLEKLGLGAQRAVANALIALYSRCGQTEDALWVFDGMHLRDTISWNSVISGCFSNGWHSRAVDFFSKMWLEGVEISSVTMVSILPACAELGYELVGKAVHGYSVKSGLLWELECLESGIDEVIGSKLVFMYVKCGDLGYARSVFDVMSTRNNVHVWNLLMGGYAKVGEFQESLLLFEQMHDLGITPDEHTISCLLKCITSLSGMRDGLVAHGYLIKLGFGAQCAVCNALISFYAKSNMIEDALKVFDEMPQRDVISWNSIISGCTSSALYNEAIELFITMWIQGQELDSTTLLSVLPACAQSCHSFIGSVIHGYSVKTGLAEQTPLANTLLDMYSNWSDWRSTNQIFKRMDQKNVVSWTAMITSYTRAGLFDKVAGLLQEMGLDGIRPDVFAVTSALHAFASGESLKQGRSVHGYTIRNGMEKLLPVANALMEMYVRCGNIEQARLIFDSVTSEDIISWNTLIGGYSRNNLANESFSLFSDMLHQFRPNAVTMTCILPAAASLSSLERGREIHAYALRRGYLEDNYVPNALVDMYVKCGALLVARRLFDQLTKKNLISWTIMIAGYGMHGRGRDAIALFEQMRGSGIEPDAASFSAILYACCHSGLREEGWRFFNAMRNEHKIEPKLKHYACIVDLLSHTGNLMEAFEFIESMPIEPDSSIWVSLLHGCRLYRDVKLAEKVAEKVFKLEPDNTGYYVLLANIYAEAEKWEAARKLKNKIGGRGLRENTGCSWIEVRGKFHVFDANNRNHPLGNRIAGFLDDVARRMREEGHDPKKKYTLMGANDAVQEEALCGHSSKLALAFGVLNLSEGRPIRVTKNSRVCSHCHEAAKFISKMCNREIILRDSNRFHHFEEGRCSCRGYC